MLQPIILSTRSLWQYKSQTIVTMKCVCVKNNATCHKQFLLIPNSQVYGFPFKVILLESNALSHSCLPHFYALDSSMMLLSFVVMVLLMASMPSKWAHLMIFLCLGKRKVTWSKNKRIGRFFQYINIPLGQELLEAQCVEADAL